ncbi:MAG: YggS family pyridoxal phosphate-dependent enzyme [Bacteroidetes bacterium]|nr:YggS family pyridoxal phosphate-dependent enzyme [Bacteroidota bacterium]
MDIVDNLQKLLQELPAHVKLIAVSKTQHVHIIQQTYAAGQRVFGENKVQELLGKYPLLPRDIEWHFVGHLQTNKIKFLVPFVSMIHSIDSFRLLSEVNRFSQRYNRVVPILLQFHIATEESKFGFSIEEAVAMLESPEFQALRHIRPAGVMGMASFTDDMQRVRDEFRQLRSTFLDLKMKYFKDNEDFREVSMGMSNDYQIAIEEGSTMVRLGTILFGERNLMP